MGFGKVGVQLQGLLHLDIRLLDRCCVAASELTDPEPVGSRQLRMRGREARIECHSPFQQLDRHRVVDPSLVPDPNLAAEEQLVRRGVVGRGAAERTRLGLGQRQLQRRHDTPRHAILDREAVLHELFDPPRPHLVP